MDALDWNDLRVAAALGRHRTLTAASKALGVSQPTASRRLQSLETQLGAALFLRTRQGLTPTAAGARLLATLGEVSRALESAGRIADDEREVAGLVRLGVTDVTALHLLEDARLGALLAAHPGLVVDLVVSAHLSDIARREVDLAVRLVPPEGADLVVRKLGTMRYGLYGAARYVARHGAPRSATDLDDHALVMPSGDLERGPEATFLGQHGGGARVVLRASGMRVLAEAAARGVGLTVLPAPLARSVPGLVELHPVPAIRARSVHLVSHRDARRVPRLRAVMQVVSAAMKARLAASAR
jgi:DNA-binding transcriptional LysR family regulator